MSIEDELPDVRDGLNRLQRIILYQLWKARSELGKESVPSALLYGRVVEHVDISPQEFQDVLSDLISSGASDPEPG